MSILIALMLLVLSGMEQAPADAQRIQSAKAELEQAWKSDSAAERVRAIQANGKVADPEVVKLVARGLHDKELDVQRAAIDALRYVGLPEALKELQGCVRDDKPLKKDTQIYALLLRALGQYGSASSLRILGDDPWSLPDPHVIQARILGLGRIRTRESLERLFELMEQAGPQRIENLMPDLRLALVVLTGADQGNSLPAWQSWWNERRARFKVDPAPPELPGDLSRKWKVYWGEAEPDYRPRKRSERGRAGASART